MENEPVPGGRRDLQERLGARLELARTDRRALDTLLREYLPFIKKCVSGVFFKGQSRADNLTDAMLAFARSVQTYRPEEGAFIQYAAAVIRNRLIDNARKELAADRSLFSLSAKAGEGGDGLEAGISLRFFDRAEEEKNLRLEIEALNGEFSAWGFSWAALLKKCPKQERSRALCRRIARALRDSPALLAETLRTRQLPVSRLAETFPRKALDKYRPYIAALIILSRGDYPFVYSFVPGPFGGEEG
jgi:RNA polymerase sigma factor